MVMMLIVDSVNAGHHILIHGFRIFSAEMIRVLPISSQMLTTKAKSILSNPVCNECFFNLKVFSKLELDVTGENQSQKQKLAVQLSASLKLSITDIL